MTSCYSESEHNPSFLLQCHSYLFTSKTLDQQLNMSYDHMQCWLQSVSEAHQVLLLHDDILQAEANSFSSYQEDSEHTTSGSYTP
jgi:hypothetical protein